MLNHWHNQLLVQKQHIGNEPQDKGTPWLFFHFHRQIADKRTLKAV